MVFHQGLHCTVLVDSLSGGGRGRGGGGLKVKGVVDFSFSFSDRKAAHFCDSRREQAVPLSMEPLRGGSVVGVVVDG